MGSEMPKNFKIAAPSSSMIARKMMLLIAILRASDRNTFGSSSPTSPRNTRDEPTGLISGKSTLNAIRNEVQSDKAFPSGNSSGKRPRHCRFPSALSFQDQFHYLACGTMASGPAGCEVANCSQLRRPIRYAHA